MLLDHEDLKNQALEAGFDLLVVDEAHHLTWHEDSGGNDRYDVVAEFAAQTAGVLLLTATPEQLGVDSHFARLRLLDPERFDTLDHFIEEEAQYAYTAKVAEVLMSDEPLNDAHQAALLELIGHNIDDSPDSPLPCD
jgi:ATP-dependent helicase HepA